MKLLAVDTALGACSAAVLDGRRILAHRFEAMARGHAERLAPMVSEVMSESGIGFAELDRLAVTTGPGTFTGQRVGIAFMRGLRVALKRPLVGMTTLQCMIAAASDASGPGACVAIHDARRDEVYCAVSLDGQPVVADRLCRYADALTLVADHAGRSPIVVAGSAGEKAAADWRALGHDARFSGVLQPDALWLARLALGAPEPHGAPRPFYLREPDAKLPKAAG
ncbi:MAG: tRNA (adenosine(37)-N6)-threonylcarbamoyltransferase complex dimerization subunit type 1 TsaB [Rhizomicrobium sp.]|jgi:tRNA threonylcarbamoyladenosine biosynthesis protein TsaB